MRLISLVLLATVCLMATGAEAFAEGKAPAHCYLIGNSLIWDTVPGRLDGDVQC